MKHEEVKKEILEWYCKITHCQHNQFMDNCICGSTMQLKEMLEKYKAAIVDSAPEIETIDPLEFIQEIRAMDIENGYSPSAISCMAELYERGFKKHCEIIKEWEKAMKEKGE